MSKTKKIIKRISKLLGSKAPNKLFGSAPRIVTLDIETAPLESFHWGLWDQNISLDQIDRDWSILAYSAKWLDQTTPIYSDTGGKGVEAVRDDKALLQEIWDILDTADIVVVQNGKEFDIKKINARLLLAGFKPYSPIRIVDTLVSARKHFGFTSNKLAYMSQKLTDTPKDSHKQFPGFELWLECLKDNPKAWAEMKKYNVVDTIATEKVYLKMLPWIGNHPNVSVYSESVVPACPKCGSDKVQCRGRSYTQSGVYQRYACTACGGWSRGKQILNTQQKRKTLLAN